MSICSSSLTYFCLPNILRFGATRYCLKADRYVKTKFHSLLNHEKKKAEKLSWKNVDQIRPARSAAGMHASRVHALRKTRGQSNKSKLPENRQCGCLGRIAAGSFVTRVVHGGFPGQASFARARDRRGRQG
eukprot:5612597-Pleurochrysis_carterae.AAC.5